MVLEVKTLSPVYIGTGEEYNRLSYIVDGGNVEFYDLRGIINDMEAVQEGKFAEFIASAVEESPKSMPGLRDLIKAICGKEAYPGLDSHCLYILPLADKLGDESKIRSFMAEGGYIYIPGTEIKGAIRTAIFYYLMNSGGHEKSKNHSFSNRIYSDLIKKLDPKRKLNVRRLKDIEKDFEGQAFRARYGRDARYDLLKYLLIRDSDLKPIAECLFVSNIKVLNVHKRYKRPRRPTGRIFIPCQLCNKDQVFICPEICVNESQLDADGLGFSGEQKWVLRCTDQLPNFFQCCHDFSNRLLEEEINYFNRKDGILEMGLLMNNLGGIREDEAERILDHVVSRLEDIKSQNKPNKPVIRLGVARGT